MKVVFEDDEFDLWVGYDGNEFCDFDNVEIESDNTDVNCETSTHKATFEINCKEKLCFKEEKDKKNL